jgi:hypothetical protein
MRWARAYNEASIEPYISLLNISSLVDHLTDEGEDAEEGDGLDYSGVAEEKYLEFGQRLLVMRFWTAVLVALMVEDLGIVDRLIGRAAEERCVF